MSNHLDIHIDLDNKAWLNEDGTLDRFAVKDALNRIVYIMTETHSVIEDVTSTCAVVAPTGATSGQAILRFKADAQGSS